jgi:hypothetical protein
MTARDRLLRLDLLGYLDGLSKGALVAFGLVLAPSPGFSSTWAATWRS